MHAATERLQSNYSLDPRFRRDKATGALWNPRYGIGPYNEPYYGDVGPPSLPYQLLDEEALLEEAAKARTPKAAPRTNKLK